MRRAVVLAAAVLSVSASAQDFTPQPLDSFSQPPASAASTAPGRFDLSGQFGYQTSPTIYFGRAVKLTDSGSFGGSFGWMAAKGWKKGHAFRSELFYLYQPSGLSTSPLGTNNPLTYNFSLYIHYIHAAALYELGNDRVRGFFSVGLGTTIMHPGDSAYGDLWLFSASTSLGLKVRLFKKFGLRGQARLLLPFLFTGGSLWCGGGGCAVGVSGGGAMLQADFTAGPYIEFG
ncbi:MAG: hypothetical protein AB1938_20150 [Myxococcota bacterium]